MNEKNLQAKAVHVRLLGTCTPWAQGKPFCDNEFARVVDLPGLGVLFEINFSCSGSKHVLLNVDVWVIIRDHLVSIWQLAAVTLGPSPFASLSIFCQISKNFLPCTSFMSNFFKKLQSGERGGARRGESQQRQNQAWAGVLMLHLCHLSSPLTVVSYFRYGLEAPPPMFYLPCVPLFFFSASRWLFVGCNRR